VTANLVPYPPRGLVVAIQYFADDEPQAMRVARLLADIEPARRDDVVLAFCRRHDAPVTRLGWETQLHCGLKFGTMAIRSERPGEGHPAGPNGLWSGTLDALSRSWRSGKLPAESVFCCEPDGVPLRPDWIDVLKSEHAQARREGKRITGPLMEFPFRHINGTMLLDLAVWLDRTSLHETPAEQAWDIFHAGALLQECRPSSLVKNVYGARNYSREVLAAMANETAWLASTKDDSAIGWAERTLVGGLGTEEPTPASGPRRVRVNG
jgi:hypothetical protein